MLSSPVLSLRSIRTSTTAWIPHVWMSPREPQEILTHIHSPRTPRTGAEFLSILSEAPRTVLHEYFQGIWDHQIWNKLVLASPLTLKLGLLEQPLDKGRWPPGVKYHQSYTCPTPFSFYSHLCPKSQDSLLGTLFESNQYRSIMILRQGQVFFVIIIVE